MFHRSVNELLYSSKIEDRVKFAINLSLSHPQNCAIEINVFPARKLRVEPGPNFEQAGCPTLEANAADRRFGDATQDFQECGFSCSISANDCDCFTRFHTKGKVL